MPSAIEFLIVEVQAFKNVLSRQNAREKGKNVPSKLQSSSMPFSERLGLRHPTPLPTFRPLSPLGTASWAVLA